MENSLKQEFIRRLSQCNKSELIIVTYDIVFAYIGDANCAHEAKDYEMYKKAIRKSQSSIDTLKNALNYQYELSRDLHQIYRYAKNELEKAIYQNKLDGLIEAEKILKEIYFAFSEVMKTDDSEPIMSNTQQIYAGITYNKTNLNENLISDSNRGLLI